jgi:polysaccharide export outer membrane protein
MKRFTPIRIMLLSLLAGGAMAAAQSSGDAKFAPLTSDGYPMVTSNVPRAVTPAATTAADASADTNVSPAPVTTVAGVVVDDRHKLAPGDKLSFRVVEDRDEAKPLVVADTGELDVPYVGRINVAGKTCKEVAGDLKAVLEKDYYYRATVVLGLDQVSRVVGRVYVWGQVRNQGPVEIPANENFTAAKAILRAGGFGDFANKKKVRVVRNAKPEAGGKQEFLVNMEVVFDEGKTENDVPLQPDDFIIVPARLVNW